MNERIKKLRKALDLTQQEFADKLGTTRNNIAGYEIGRRAPSVAVITLICREFNVSEAWLRTGEGEMFAERTEEDELAAAVERLITGESAEFKRRLITALASLKEEQWLLLEKKLREIVETHNENAASPTPVSKPEPAPPAKQEQRTPVVISKTETTTPAPQEPDIMTKLDKLERQNRDIMAQNQILAAEVAAMREEDAVNEMAESVSASPMRASGAV